MKILYAEDEIAMSEAVTDILTYHKYTVDAVYDGEEALAFARAEVYDAIILDIMMPKKSGMEVLRALRAEGCKTPIILLTAKAEVEDRVEGLDAGADDYLPKPFDMAELLARVRAVLRRRETFVPEVITCGDLSLNMQSCALSCGDRSFVLSKIEYRMMELLMLHRGMYFSTEDLLTKVWGYDTESELGIVWVYISNLRKKLVALHAHAEIRVKRGIGYMLEAVQ